MGVVTGPRAPEGWLSGDSEPMDFLDAKGILETLLGRLRVDGSFQPAEDSLFMPGPMRPHRGWAGTAGSSGRSPRQHT